MLDKILKEIMEILDKVSEDKLLHIFNANRQTIIDNVTVVRDRYNSNPNVDWRTIGENIRDAIAFLVGNDSQDTTNDEDSDYDLHLISYHDLLCEFKIIDASTKHQATNTESHQNNIMNFNCIKEETYGVDDYQGYEFRLGDHVESKYPQLGEFGGIIMSRSRLATMEIYTVQIFDGVTELYTAHELKYVGSRDIARATPPSSIRYTPGTVCIDLRTAKSVSILAGSQYLFYDNYYNVIEVNSKTTESFDVSEVNLIEPGKEGISDA